MKGYIKKIAESPLFNNIEERDLPVMLECLDGKIRVYDRDEIILLSSDQVRYVGVVLDGCIHMVKETPDGGEVLLTIMRNGELFGESFVCLDDTTSYVTFVATTKTIVLFVPFQKTMAMCPNSCQFHNTLLKNMVVMLSNKNVRLMQKIDISSRKSLREKLIAFLLLEKNQQNSDVITISMNRTVLADYLGVNRSALTRELSAMKEEGLLEFHKNTFHLYQI